MKSTEVDVSNQEQLKTFCDGRLNWFTENLHEIDYFEDRFRQFGKEKDYGNPQMDCAYDWIQEYEDTNIEIIKQMKYLVNKCAEQSLNDHREMVENYMNTMMTREREQQDRRSPGRHKK